MYQTLTFSQTDAIVWNILVNRSVWELCTRMLMKNWGFCERGYFLGKKKSQFLGIDIAPNWVDLRLFMPIQRKMFPSPVWCVAYELQKVMWCFVAVDIKSRKWLVNTILVAAVSIQFRLVSLQSEG